MSQSFADGKISSGAKACGEYKFSFLSSFPALDKLGRPRAGETSVLDLLTNNSTSGARMQSSQPGASALSQGHQATPNSAASSSNSRQEQPALPDTTLLFAELLSAGTMETAGSGRVENREAKGQAKEPSRKSPSKGVNPEAPVSPATALLALSNAISPIQFDPSQLSSAGTVGEDVPQRNAEMEAEISNRDLGLGSDGLLALHTQWGETTGAGIYQPDGENRGAELPDDGEAHDDQALQALSPALPTPSAPSGDSQTGDKELSATPDQQRDLNLPVPEPADPQSYPVLPGDLEPKSTKNGAFTGPLKSGVASHGVSGQARLDHEPVGGAGHARPINPDAETAGVPRPGHAPGKATPIAMPNESGGPAEAVFSLLMARADGGPRPDHSDVETRRESPTDAANLEPIGIPESSEENFTELLHSHRKGPQPPVGDQNPPESFRQPGESASPSPAFRAPEFSSAADGTKTPEPTEQVWSLLDAGGVTPETDSAVSAQTLSSLDLTSIGPERISVRVVESRGGLEVRVATPDTVAKERLLTGLEELAGRVRELSLGTLVPGLEPSDTGQGYRGEERQHPAFDHEDRRPRVKKAGTAFALPVDLLGEPVSSPPMRPV